MYGFIFQYRNKVLQEPIFIEMFSVFNAYPRRSKYVVTDTYVGRKGCLFQLPRFRALDLAAGVDPTGWIGRRTLTRPPPPREILSSASLAPSDERGNFLRLRVDLSGAVV